MAVLAAGLLGIAYLAALALALVMLSQGCCVGASPAFDGDAWVARDRDLIPLDQRAFACAFGRAAIEWDGIVYVLEDVPREYIDGGRMS